MFLLVTVYWLREPSGRWGKWGIFPSIPLPANKDGQWTLHGMCCWYEDMCWSNVLGHNNMQTQLSNLMTCTAYCINTDNDPYDLYRSPRQEMICCLLSRQPPTPKPCWSCWLRHPRCLIEPGFCCRGIHKVMFAKTIWICLQNIVRITKLPFKSRVPRGWNQLMTRWSDSLNRWL